MQNIQTLTRMSEDVICMGKYRLIKAMLLQRCTKELELQKWNSSIRSTVDPDERVRYQCHPMIRKDSALIIREASSIDDEVGSNHDVNTSSSSFDKGKNATHAFSVFERG
ncbi:PREDICTED: uncharacterized protein LOC109222862 [Nicotiana attenuata]|uniref:uncharacterized protein LOC109222862 n=1 Tax=Nicotiana attenuata TaxID=49451 RepID=UPI000904751B|nr:PREDICTED: uncharacterized protein LOC109222862 [Nicotiana attenuata]